MGHNATRSQQAKARVREARLGLLSERQAQDERIEEATVRTVLAWEDAVAAHALLDAAERKAGEAMAALGKEKVPVAQMVTLTGIGKPQCARLLRLASAQADPAEPDGEQDVSDVHSHPDAAAPHSELAAVEGDTSGDGDRRDVGGRQRADAAR
jgi:hypothetical protein